MIFYRKVSRMQNSKSPETSALEVRYEDNILQEWKKYHKDLYTTVDNPAFDNYFKIFVKTKLEEYAHESLTHLEDSLEKPFELQEVADVCKELPTGNAGGLGSLTNEHPRYGGQ